MDTKLPLIRVPEFIIHDSLSKALDFIRKDYTAQANKSNSYLYKLLETGGFQKYKNFEQAEQVFIVDETHPRYLDIDLMFNMDRDGAPTIHITMPSESPGQNAIGNEEGYQEPLWDDPSNNIVNKTYSSVFTRRYKATYDIVITSDNNNEVLLIYHVLKALLVALTGHLHLSGLENISFSGQDLQPYAELTPKNIFLRAIRLGVEYESSTLSFEKFQYALDIIFKGTAVEEL